MNFFRSRVNRPFLVMIFMGFFLALTMLVLAFVTNQSADVVIGQAAFNQNGINGHAADLTLTNPGLKFYNSMKY